jgi:hypothetical protein
MANQKADLHSINLRTQDVCLNKYNHDIKQYDGFRKNNSPFYGNVLSPFYGRVFGSIGSDSYVTKEGFIYSLKDGSLFVQKGDDELQLSNAQEANSRFIIKNTMTTSGNDSYANILGYFQIGDDYKMLCSSEEGVYAIINSDATVLYEWTSEVESRYQPSEKIHFTEYAADDDTYCFAVGSSIYFVVNGELIRDTILDNVNNVSFGCVRDNGHFIICRRNNVTHYSEILTTNTTGPDYFNKVTSVRLVLGESNNHDFSDSTFDLFFNKSKNVVFTSKAWLLESEGIPLTGNNVTYIDDTTISIDRKMYQSNVTDLSNYDNLSSIFSNYSNFSLMGYSGQYDIYHPAYTITTKHTGTTYHKLFGITYKVTTSTWYTEQTVPAWTEVSDGGYLTTFVDAGNQKRYNNVPIGTDGSYAGGTFATVEDNVRTLYHGGELQGISIANDSETVGTMLCTMSEIDSDFPITVQRVGDITYVYYKDSNAWNCIIVTPDTKKATLKVLNDEYLLVNTTDYYNCFSILDRQWHHYGSDWNDRAVFSCTNNVDSADRTDSQTYINNCDSYYFATAQAANYEALSTPFISTIFPSYSGLLPKQNSNITCNIVAGGTPNGQDIDVYYGRTIDYGSAPIYVASYDYSLQTLTKYTNNKLDNTNFAFSFTLTPSIFAEFIKGFINQGIIIDNDHSYIQVFVNNVKPVFAINFSSQLEGISSAFIIQGQYYVVINGSIYRYNNGAVEAIVNIDDMTFIGNNPYMALFWSSTNKTFYRFTGDNQLYPVIQADEVDYIKQTSFNPNTLSIYIITDKNILIMSPDTLVKLPYTEYDKCFPLISGAAFSGSDSTLEISYNKLDGYDIIPIDLETELYGYGNSVKAVNDCVYIRLYDNDMKAGKVIVSSETLNEHSRLSFKKEFNITPDMWDKESKTIFLRYQPENQAATGFSVHIISPFAIATMQISSTPETVQNSKYNI